MFEPTYRQAVQFAGKIVSRSPLVLIFGLLSIGVGQFGMSDFFGQLLLLTSAPATLLALPHYVFPGFSASGLLWFLWLLLLLIPLLILVVFVAVAAQGALMAYAIDTFRHHGDNIEQAWHKGVRHFWRLLGLQILKKLAFALLFVAMALLITPWVGATSFGGSVLRAVLVTISFLLALYITSVTMFAGGYIIQDGASLGIAMQRGSRLWSRHILVSLEMSLLSVAANVVLIFVIYSGLGILTAIPTALFSLLGALTGFRILFVIGVYLGGIAALALVALLAALSNALITSAWMYLFMKMHHEGVLSRLRTLLRRGFLMIESLF